MRVGWLADESAVAGGAELTQSEFRTAAPEDVEIVDCLPGKVVEGLDLYVVQNCVRYSLDDLTKMSSRVIKYWHDVGSWLQPGVKEWLDDLAEPVCCSPLQCEYMGLEHAAIIPPPVDLTAFEQAAASVNGGRKGFVSVNSWRNLGKAPHKTVRFGQEHGVNIDFYGGGPFAPEGSTEIPYDQMPELLAGYDTFVFLPAVIEPFGRVVVEAWAAGCRVITNSLVGARYWIEQDPEAIATAADDFWTLCVP